MTPHYHNLRIDMLSARYLAAVESDDFEVQNAIWELAETNEELTEAINDIQEGLLEELREQESRTIERSVTTAMPSAVIVRESSGPVTVGDVAEELFYNAGNSLAADSYVWIETLRSSAEPLPEDLKLSKLTAWAESKFGNAPAGFWKVFHQGVLKLEQRRASETEYALAARRAPKPEGTE